MATTACQWRMLPNDFPPVSTVRGCFYAWRDDGLLDEVNRKLVEATRLAEGRKAEPTACVFRGDAPTDSDLMRPPVPISSAHRFRGMRPPL